jgi:hypothetical protein
VVVQLGRGFGLGELQIAPGPRYVVLVSLEGSRGFLSHDYLRETGFPASKEDIGGIHGAHDASSARRSKGPIGMCAQ